jgi:hypothetical protein
MIAEDVDAAGCKGLVRYDAEGRPDSLKYDKVIMYHQEIIRHQQARIDALEARLKDIEEKLK